MATLLEYAEIAQAVYSGVKVQTFVNHTNNNGAAGWKIRYWEAGSFANGFQGTILENNTEVICAFKGSQPKGKTFVDDWLVNDLQIGINMVPSQTPSALDMVRLAQQHICGGLKPLSIVGHSLGGGLAQLAGYLLGVPFVTFNGPGMYQNIPTIPFVPLTTLLPYGYKKWKGEVNGFNLIIGTDPVGNAGRHIGKTKRFSNQSKYFAHLMKAVIPTIQAHPTWAAKTLPQLL